MLLHIHSLFKVLVGSVDSRFVLREKGAFQMPTNVPERFFSLLILKYIVYSFKAPYSLNTTEFKSLLFYPLNIQV